MPWVRWSSLGAIVTVLGLVGLACAGPTPTPIVQRQEVPVTVVVTKEVERVVEKEVTKVVEKPVTKVVEREVTKVVEKEVEKPPAPPVKIMAVYAQSGRWAFNGAAVLAGIRTAINDINRQGGIKALGGAPLQLVTADAGDSPERAGSAVARLLSNNPDVVAGMGCWLSSFTLSCTEITEREGLPWVTLSYSDAITDRGFRFVFDTSPPGSQQARAGIAALLEIAESKGIQVTKTGYTGDNTAAAVSFRNGVLAAMQERGIPVVMDEVFTPPLADATSIVQQVRDKLADGDILWYMATSFADAALGLQKLAEFQLKVLPAVNGAQALLPQYRQLGDIVLGLTTMVPHHVTKSSQDIADHIAAETGYEFVWQDQIAGYMNTWIIKEAIERAGKADREAIAQALREMEVTSGPIGDIILGGRLKFDETGRREGVVMALVQWQKVNGTLFPCTVYPPEQAACEMKWPGVDSLQ